MIDSVFPPRERCKHYASAMSSLDNGCNKRETQRAVFEFIGSQEYDQQSLFLLAPTLSDSAARKFARESRKFWNFSRRGNVIADIMRIARAAFQLETSRNPEDGVPERINRKSAEREFALLELHVVR